MDTEKELVYFTGTKDGALESHLYVASYRDGADPSQVVRLTDIGYSHEVNVLINSDATYFVTKYSNVTHRPCVSVFKVTFLLGVTRNYKFLSVVSFW